MSNTASNSSPGDFSQTAYLCIDRERFAKNSRLRGNQSASNQGVMEAREDFFRKSPYRYDMAGTLRRGNGIGFSEMSGGYLMQSSEIWTFAGIWRAALRKKMYNDNIPTNHRVVGKLLSVIRNYPYSKRGIEKDR